MRTLLSLSILLLIISMVLIIFIVLYYLYWKPKVIGNVCTSNQDCYINQSCSQGYCIENLCSNDANCNNTSLCVDSYCQEYRCITSNDCPIGTACNTSNNTCINIGTTCQNNMDCFGLSCVNNVCLQCTTNSNCNTGQACFNNICRYPNTSTEVTPNTITFSSPAQTNGNITAPPNYSCNKVSCNINDLPVSCTGGTGGTREGIVGDSKVDLTEDPSTLCPSSCPFCVNSLCRCTIGQDLEECRINVDCLSGLCKNNICVPIGNECVSNAGGDLSPCPINLPYCVNGKCSNVSLNAICGGTGMPEDLCNNPQSLGAIGLTGITPNGMGFFCVDGRCSMSPGKLNQLCTINSCTTYNDIILACKEVVTPNIILMRCLV